MSNYIIYVCFNIITLTPSESRICLLKSVLNEEKSVKFGSDEDSVVVRYP